MARLGDTLPKPGSIQTFPGMPTHPLLDPALLGDGMEPGTRHHVSVGLISLAHKSRTHIFNNLRHHGEEPNNMIRFHLPVVPSATQRVCLLFRTGGISPI